MATKSSALARTRSAAGYTQETFAFALRVDVSTVGRWETGASAPLPTTRPKVAKLLRLSLVELDQLLHTVKIQSNRRTTRSASTVLGASSRRSQLSLLDDLRRSIIGRPVLAGEPPDRRQLMQAVNRAHSLYQHADYEAAAKMLPQVIDRLNGQSSNASAAARKAYGYVAAAKLATKLGSGSLAWLAADRASLAALDAGRAELTGIARYQVACALLLNGHLGDAEEVVEEAIEDLRLAKGCDDVRVKMSVQGALSLLAAVMAARSGASQNARERLRQASEFADVLGCEGNFLWTGFGPTNVAIHELSVTVQLGDARRSYELGSFLDTDRLPDVLVGRRSQVHLDLGRAAMSVADDGLAVLHLLEAERVAKQAVSRNAGAREVIQVLLGRERHNATPGLRALALRAGVDA
ncbi:helix-turn-helix transcriptional regulator [Amycolatopsis sp. NPDC049868]|uniref:helix-turn-helix transcriptional regulator n=1 Tax=Amycolatopsis sp. NPDC049868 TaxID=3363934 RepID=UPI0037873A5A